MNPKSLDWINSILLKERGNEIGLKSFPKIPTKKLIKNGLFYGFIILILQSIFYSIILVYSVLLDNKIKKLEPEALNFDNLSKLINASNKEINLLTKTNKDISERILDQKSLFALMQELNKVNLKEVSLSKIILEKDNIKIEGMVSYPRSLQKINGFILSLNNSKFILKDSFKLVKLITKDANIKNLGNIDKIKITSFEIKGNIRNNYNHISLEYLDDLQAFGISNRFKKVIDQGYER